MRDLDLNGLFCAGAFVYGLWLLGGDRWAGAGLIVVALLIGYARSKAARKAGR